MVAAVETELRSRVAALEYKVARLEELLDYAQAVAGIRRGLAEASEGKGTPAREWAEQMRAKHKLPAP